ncbi:MAG: COQ9 family protein [Bdellovibrionales bacterium]
MSRRNKEHLAQNNSDASVRDALAKAALAQVAQEGWTRKAYAQGILKSGVSRGEADLLFPQGLLDVIDWLDALSDEAMHTRIAAEPDFMQSRMRDKVTFAIRARLEARAPYREAVKRLVAWYAMPLHAPLAARKVMTAADAIWKAVGDRSTDFSFYTRRMMLAGVLKAVTLFWIGDESTGSRATWDFLDRRMADVMRFGKTISLLKEWSPAEIVEMVGRRIRRA